MNTYQVVKSKYFIATGISHQEAEVSVREKFSIDETSAKRLMKEYIRNDGEAIFVLSTCNRTEIYALANSPDEVASLLVKYSKALPEDFFHYCYVHLNEKAIEHLFNVAVGLESQILGDFQIIGQLKKAFKLSKSMKASNAFMERLINKVSEASKKVKNETDFSSGAASTSYAAVNYIKNCIPGFQDKKVLLYGTGKIGQLVCENLTKHLSKEQITVVNRTEDKASRLVDNYNIQMGHHQNLAALIDESEIIIVATGAPQPTVTTDLVSNQQQKYFIDLSIPRNVSHELESVKNITVADLDVMTQIADETLDNRKAQIGQVKVIIQRNIDDFTQWLHQRKYVPTITAIRQLLEEIQEAEINKFLKEFNDSNPEHIKTVSSDIIRKITNQLSNQLKSVPVESIHLVHHLFKIDSRKLS